jgi:hypothetical protein
MLWRRTKLLKDAMRTGVGKSKKEKRGSDLDFYLHWVGLWVL